MNTRTCIVKTYKDFKFNDIKGDSVLKNVYFVKDGSIVFPTVELYHLKNESRTCKFPKFPDDLCGYTIDNLRYVCFKIEEIEKYEICVVLQENTTNTLLKSIYSPIESKSMESTLYNGEVVLNIFD